MRATRSSNLNTGGLSRRDVLLGGGALAGAAVLGSGLHVPTAFAQGKPVSAVMSSAFLPDSVRAVLQTKTGVVVENAPYVSPTDTLAKLLAPGGTARYDLMISVTNFVRGPALGASAGEEQVMPLDLAKIPNAAKVMDLFQPDIIKRDGKTYLMPLVWGYDSVIYNADHIPVDDKLTQSWGLLFDDKYAGRVAWRDDAHQTMTAAALHLGIAEPHKMDAGQIKEVGKFLTVKKKNVRTLWTTFAIATNLLASGEVWALYGWIPMRATLQKRGMNITNNWPADGLLVWSQGAFIPKDSPNADNAHKIINGFLDTDFGKVLVSETNYPTTSREIAGQFSPEDRKKFGLDIVERGVKTYALSFPTEMDLWLETWNTVKAA